MIRLVRREPGQNATQLAPREEVRLLVGGLAHRKAANPT
jgi:hypothetical protein